jgi:putative peptidoglycan lipid II flippase
VLLALQLVLRVADAAFPVLLAMWFGRSSATDVYFFSWAAFAIFGSVLFVVYQDSAIVPILTEVRLRSPAELGRVVGSLLAHTLIVGGALAGGIGIVAIGFFAVRYEGPDLAIAAKMVPLFSLVLVAMGARTLLSAILGAHGRFVFSPLAQALGMLVTIGLVAVGHERGVAVIPAASLGGEMVATAALSYLAFGITKIPVRWTLARPEPVLRFYKLGGAEAVGSALTRVNPMVDQVIASLAGVVGGGTLLRYSQDIATSPTPILAASLLPVLLSHLSTHATEGNLDKVRRTVRKSLAVVALALGAVAVFLFLVRRPLMEFVFLRGEMDAAGVERMIRLVPYHLVGIPSFGALLVLAKAHVAIKNSRIMIGMGALNAGLNLFFDVILAKAIGLEGIALATSCVHTAIAIVFFMRFESRLAQARVMNA